VLALAALLMKPPAKRTRKTGPVVTVQKFDTEEEAIRLANSTTYGLTASLWTTDMGKAMRVSDAIESGKFPLNCSLLDHLLMELIRFAEPFQTGMVWVNTWLMRDLRTPFGGIKESGVGREGGLHSLHFFSEEKNVTLAYNTYAQCAGRRLVYSVS
jgi:aminomuconate-semialdehyde/2-hydroxymuconate-6-semialdehyde dehydrogenase